MVERKAEVEVTDVSFHQLYSAKIHLRFSILLSVNHKIEVLSLLI